MEAEQEASTEVPSADASGEASAKTLLLSDLKEMTIQQLNAMARELKVAGAGIKKHDLIFKILQTQTETSGLLFAEGVLGILGAKVMTRKAA